ncbi:MAG: helix-turn-helix transcriptional regulator [bacterium]
MDKSEKFRKDIATRLRAARENAGLSQGQVARLLGYNRPTITEMEAGRRRISADELPKFARVYGVSVSWLTDDTPEDYNPAIGLAARELNKLKPEDLDKIMNLLKTLRNAGGSPI